jgi:glutathione peroxidase
MLAAALLLTAPMNPDLAPAEPKSVYDFKVKAIDGKPVKLDKYKGKVLLIVNTASKCGLTPQYKGLQAVYDKYKDQGLVVIGFPANDFMGQEPGTNEEIATFCERNYGVTFPMMEKITVKGEGTAPLYKWLLAHSDRPTDEIEWNFAKFVIGRNGQEVKRLTPKDTPESPTTVEAIEAALAAK